MISIIILTHNSARFIGPCLESIISRKGSEDIEIIIVDNGSEDDTLSCAEKYKHRIKLIANKENLGPCRGRNQAIEKAKGEWIMSLDCDVVLSADFLPALRKTIASLGPQIGMLQPKILKPDNKTVYSCGIYLSWLRRFYDLGHGKKDSPGRSTAKYVFGPCAAAGIYRRQMLEQIKEENGYFDERFFFFVEDVDIAWRAQRRSWKCLYQPAMVCTHAGNSSGYEKELRQYYCLRNRFYMISKNEGFLRYSLRLIPLVFYDLPRMCVLYVLNRFVRKKDKIRDCKI